MREVADFLADVARQGRRVLIACHRNADPDAVGSALALADAIRSIGARAEAGASEGISKASQQVLRLVGEEIAINPSLDADVIVLVDTSSLEHLGELGEGLKRTSAELVIIDHHRPVDEVRKLAKIHFAQEGFTSESELILSLIRGLGLSPTPKQANLLLAGIIADTGHFKSARPETFEAVHFLIESGADYRRVLDALRLPEDLSKRMAMLKAAQRAEVHKVGGYLVTFSEVGSFEGDAAAMLLKVGADVAFVGSEEEGRFRLCSRARPEVCAEGGLHLGEVLGGLAKDFRGSGGGHAGAAAMNGEGSLEGVKKRLLEVLPQAFRRLQDPPA